MYEDIFASIRQAAEKRNLRERTIQLYCSDVGYFLRCTNKPSAELSLEDADAFLTMKRLEGRSPETHNHYRSSIKFLYKRVLKIPWDDEEVPAMKRERNLPTVLTPQEMNAIIDATDNLKHKAMQRLQSDEQHDERRSETMKKITKIDVPEHPEQRRLQVAAYARVSTDSDEQLVSLDAQKTYYEKLIRSNPDWDYTGLYYDEGISGTKTDKRDGLLRMLEDCRKGKIDYIVVKSISRLARNTVDTLEIVRQLTDLGIFISFEKENINTLDASGEMLLSQTALSAQRTYEIRELASFFDGLDGPVESYDETYVRRLLSQITVFEDRLVFAFKDGKEVTIQG